jgi:hypothetical protein
MATKKKSVAAPAPEKESAPMPEQKLNLPAAPIEDLFASDGGVGFDEGVDAGAYALPFLSVLQGLSPQCQRGTPEYLVGAQPGIVINTVTKGLFDVTLNDRGETKDRLLVSVLRRTHTFCRWNKREDGGGFLGEMDSDVATVQAFSAITPDDKGRRIDPEGKEVTEHRNFYVQVLHADGSQEPAVISMTKSQLKAAREWNTLIGMRSVRGANGAGVATSEIWALATQLKKNKKGDQWYGWTVKHHARHSDPALYQSVREAVTFAREQKLNPKQLAALPDAQEEGGEM